MICKARIEDPYGTGLSRHEHRQDQFVFILQGRPIRKTDEGRTQLSPGTWAGFKEAPAMAII